MKVFLDTNIFLEYFERRRQYEYVDQLLSAVTINLKDFSRADTSAMEILSPEEFTGKYL